MSQPDRLTDQVDDAVAEAVARAFDAGHYARQLGGEAVDDAPAHYLAEGWRRGLDPSPSFRTRFYLRAYPDVAAAGVNPLVHWLTEGRDQGRAATPSQMTAQALGADGAFDLLYPEVDHAFYLAQCPSLKGTTINPVQHYLTWGWRLGFDPQPGFSTAFYLSRSPDIRRAGMNPFHHWLGWGRAEGRAPHPDALKTDRVEHGEEEALVAPAFDRDFYLNRHPELVDNHVDPVLHYLAFGWGQGFDPTPTFSTRWYLSRSPDVARAGMNPFYHYLKWGRLEGRSPSPDAPSDLFGPQSQAEVVVARAFDADFYRARNPDAAATHVDPVKHYLRYGWRNHADPSAEFSTAFYLSRDPDLVDRGENPLLHYLTRGRARGRLPRSPFEPGAAEAFLDGERVVEALRPEFDAGFYAEAYPEVAAGDDPVLDYVRGGWRAGRDPAPWFSTRDYLDRYPDVEAGGWNPFFHYLVWGRAQGFRPWRDPADGETADVVGEAEAVKAPDLRALATPSLPPAEPVSVDPAQLDLHWMVADFGAGGRGAPSPVLNLVHELELRGHRCTLWIRDPDHAVTAAERNDAVLRTRPVRADIRLWSNAARLPPGAVLIATDWACAHQVAAIGGAVARAYLMQADEAARHPAGSRALAADRALELDLACLCAGRWLDARAKARGRWSRPFPLAPSLAHAPPRTRAPGAPPRIALAGGDGAAVDLALLALERLAAQGERFAVDLVGARFERAEAPFTIASHGALEGEALAALYAECDLGLWPSAGPSTAPLEMMACGLPLVALDGEAARAGLPDGTATLAAPDPAALAEAVGDLLHAAPARADQARRAAAWVGGLSWEASARAVEQALVTRLELLGVPFARAEAAVPVAPSVSVLMLTQDGGARFRAVLERVLAQRTARPFEVVTIDGGSTDGTWEHLEAQGAQVRRLRIDRADVRPGRTRNLAAGVATGDWLVLLGQHDLPVGASWLEDLVTSLERHPLAAGAVGRVRPAPDAFPFAARDLEARFAVLDREPLEGSRHLAPHRWRDRDEAFRRFLHAFDGGDAVLRRSVWARHPFPEVEQGWDVAWADALVATGYGRVYAPRAVVERPLNPTEADVYACARAEARFTARAFGRPPAPADPESDLRRMNAADRAWGVRRGVPDEAIEAQARLNAAGIAGRLAAEAELDEREANDL